MNGIELAKGGMVFAAAVVLVVLSLHVPMQVVLVAIGLMVAFIINRRVGALIFAVLLIPTISLIRRITAGPSGYTEADPLILLPLLLVVVVVAMSWTRPTVLDHSLKFTHGAASATIAGIAVSVLLTTSFDMNGLFFAGLIIVPLMLAIVLSSGRMPPVWEQVAKVLPWLGFFVGSYGIIQFFFVPSWDRAWMITSKLTSIGLPFPMEVRVFGASESPGPYALFLGLVVTFCLSNAVVLTGGVNRFGWVALASYLVFPLILSGVRSALLSVGICALILALVRATGIARVLIPVFLIVGYQALTLVISRFGTNSTILNADRYTEVSAGDDSLVARLGLLKYLANPLQHLVGNPNAPVVDNLFIDTMLRYGLLAAAGLLALHISIVVIAVGNVVRKQNEVVSVCAIFIGILSLFGPSFNALFGILIGIVFGTVMTAPKFLVRKRPNKRSLASVNR
ncbi:hypothetical protein [Cryobacterium ruanii]|uniref:O-antigen ligase domain-containing protein n=1 Tax=Cryobacterium ruanii TaxID=1259197 RepID=A0A4R9ANS4_9MICO|nr:hypothetical protein [Cryobacterium ruanii]TFD66515.1 hypothetical protein E3T47_08585 [Cryobacterium ruanii]